MLFKLAKGVGLLAIGAALAPFAILLLIAMTVFGFVTFTIWPLILLGLVGWLVLRTAARNQRDSNRGEPTIIEGEAVRLDALRLDPAAYSPPVHFDLMLSAKHDIGRIRGATKAIEDAAVSRQFRELAERADKVLERVLAEPQRLGFARVFFSSLLPKSADMAEGYILQARQTVPDPNRRQNLIDVAHRLSDAIRDVEKDLSGPDLQRLDIDLRLLNADLKRASGIDPARIARESAKRQ